MSRLFAYVSVSPPDVRFQCKKCGCPFSGMKTADAEKFPCPKCEFEFNADNDSIFHQLKQITDYCWASQECLDVQELVAFKEVVEKTTLLLDRPAARQILKPITRGDHIAFSDFRNVFLNAADFISQTSRLLRMGVTIHLASKQLVISPYSPQAELIETLGVFQLRSFRSSQQLRAKRRAIKNGRAGGPPRYGWQSATGEDGKRAKAPDWAERRLMSELLEWREDGEPWRKITDRVNKSARYNNRRSPTGQYDIVSLQRMHKAAMSAEFPLSQ